MRRKPTGELQFFIEVWKSIPIYQRICFVSGDRITHFHVMCFAHILGKGEFPELRLERDNIVLLKARLHQQQHSVARSKLEATPGKIGDGWRKFFSLQDERRQQHNK